MNVIKISFYLLASAFLLFQTGCFLNAKISDTDNIDNIDDGDDGDDNTKPSTLSLSLQTPGYLIFDDATPSFDVSNVTIGHTLKLYKDSSCSVEIASVTVTQDPQAITASTSLADGNYQFSARTFDGGSAVSSTCANLSGTYELNTATPSVSTITPTSLPTFTGGLLTLDGSDFVMGSTISFIRADGESFNCLTPQFISTSQITCTVPGFNEAIVSVRITKPTTTLQATLSNSLTFAAPLPTALLVNKGMNKWQWSIIANEPS